MAARQSPMVSHTSFLLDFIFFMSISRVGGSGWSKVCWLGAVRHQGFVSWRQTKTHFSKYMSFMESTDLSVLRVATCDL